MGKASKAWAVGGILVAVVASSACRGRTTNPSDAGGGSQVAGVVVDSQADIGTFDGVRFERLVGHVEGQVHRTENVAGLAEILGEADHHTYRSAFEVIRPVEGSDRQLMVVEVENRGSPIMLQLFNRFTIGFSGAPGETRYPAGVGDGFLFGGGRSYAGDVAVPELDGDGQPVGGVRFPEADLPLGRPEPPAVPPVITTTNVCGNFGGYQPFSAAELERRYGSSSAYEQRVQPLVDRLVGQGWLLPGDRQWVIDDLRRRFDAT